MKNLLTDIIAGARPNFMKIAQIVRALQARQKSGSNLRYRLSSCQMSIDGHAGERIVDVYAGLYS